MSTLYSGASSPSFHCRACKWEIHNVDSVERLERGLLLWKESRLNDQDDYEAFADAVTWSE